MALDPALGAAHALARDAPQQALAVVAVGGRGGRPHLEVVRRGAGDGVDEGLQALLVHVGLLYGGGVTWRCTQRVTFCLKPHNFLSKSFFQSVFNN